MERTGVWAVVVAAGSGTRFGGPKQHADLGGRTVLEWAVDGARRHCDGLVIVVAAADAPNARTSAGAHAVVPGGATRSASVRAGLRAVPDEADIVVVHDAARPLASGELWDRVIDAVRGGADAAIPALPVTDTLKRVRGCEVVDTVDRTDLVTVQTPQAFRALALRQAHTEGDDATDDAALIEAAGGRVVVVPGDARNLKITHPEDLETARRLAAQA